MVQLHHLGNKIFFALLFVVDGIIDAVPTPQVRPRTENDLVYYKPGDPLPLQKRAPAHVVEINGYHYKDIKGGAVSDPDIKGLDIKGSGSGPHSDAVSYVDEDISHVDEDISHVDEDISHVDEETDGASDNDDEVVESEGEDREVEVGEEGENDWSIVDDADGDDDDADGDDDDADGDDDDADGDDDDEESVEREVEESEEGENDWIKEDGADDGGDEEENEEGGVEEGSGEYQGEYEEDGEVHGEIESRGHVIYNANPASPSSTFTNFHRAIGTVYSSDGGPGSCGIPHGDNAMIAALGNKYMSYAYKSSLCGRKINVTNVGADYNVRGEGNSLIVTVADTCASCEGDHVDFSEAAWKKLTDGDEAGVVNLEWAFVGEK